MFETIEEYSTSIEIRSIHLEAFAMRRDCDVVASVALRKLCG